MTTVSPTLVLLLILGGIAAMIWAIRRFSRARVAGNPSSTGEDGLSMTAYLVYSLCFLFLPGVCVVVSSVLYYWWKESKPRQANQINRLGFIIVGMHLGLYLVARQLGE